MLTISIYCLSDLVRDYDQAGRPSMCARNLRKQCLTSSGHPAQRWISTPRLALIQCLHHHYTLRHHVAKCRSSHPRGPGPRSYELQDDVSLRVQFRIIVQIGLHERWAGTCVLCQDRLWLKRRCHVPRSGSRPGGNAGTLFTIATGEHASLNAIHDAVPNFCPRSHAHGALRASSGKFFLVTDFLELGTSAPAGSGESLATKLAKLHTTPAPIPKGFDKPMFGFPVATCCGATEQDNSWKESWADFYANNRLRGILREGIRNNGADRELSDTVEKVASLVVPRLLGDNHLKGVTPVVIHGDLWSGNHGRGRIAGKGGSEEVVYDPSCVYGHSEYELGIMRMFGGFGSSFWREYESLVPKAKPKEEWEDRISLYEL